MGLARAVLLYTYSLLQGEDQAVSPINVLALCARARPRISFFFFAFEVYYINSRYLLPLQGLLLLPTCSLRVTAHVLTSLAVTRPHTHAPSTTAPESKGC